MKHFKGFVASLLITGLGLLIPSLGLAAKDPEEEGSRAIPR